MTTPSAEPKRIVVRASGVNHDLVVAADNQLVQVLTTLGVQLGASEQLLSPDGTAIDPSTRAVDLSDGGVYSITSAQSPRQAAARGVKRSSRRVHAGALWGLAMLGIVLVAGSMQLAPGWLRLSAAIALGISGLIVALLWAVRTAADTAVSGMLVPLGFGAAAAALSLPSNTADAATLTVTIAALAAAVLAGMIAVLSNDLRSRAGAWAAAIVLLCIGAVSLLSPLVGWSLPQLAIVLSAAAVLAIRALPTLTLSVDDGYHVDYQRFMALRWTVRGRMPEYISTVESVEAHRLVDAAEARLETTMPLLALVAVPGLPLSLTVLATGGTVERIAAGAVFVFGVLGLLLLSRRTVSPSLRRSPRIAVAVALGVSVVVAPVVLSSAVMQLALAAGLLIAGLVAAAVVLPISGGSRSLSWSRTGDIVESIAIALVVPAALLAAGTFDTLRGVLVA